MKKICRSVGPEWLAVFLMLTVFIEIMAVMTFYYMRKGEAKRLADSLSHMIVYDKDLVHKYSYINKEEKNYANENIVDEDTYLFDMLEQLKNLRDDYGVDYINYFLKKEGYKYIDFESKSGLSERSYQSLILYRRNENSNNISEIIPIGEIIDDYGNEEIVLNSKIDMGILLSDNRLYYLNDAGKLRRGKIEIEKKDFSLRSFDNHTEIYNSFLGEPDTYTYHNSDMGYQRYEGYFIPKLKRIRKKIENIVSDKNDFSEIQDYINMRAMILYSEENNIGDIFNSESDIFEEIEFDVSDIGKRYVIEQKITKNKVKQFINNYNSFFRKNNGNLDRKFYTDFAIEGLTQEEGGYPDFFLEKIEGKYDYLTGTSIEEEKRNKINHGIRKNRKSFFFYSQTIDGVLENFGYRMRPEEAVLSEDRGIKYYPVYPNSLHLVLLTKINLPLIENASREIRFHFDLTLNN